MSSPKRLYRNSSAGRIPSASAPCPIGFATPTSHPGPSPWVVLSIVPGSFASAAWSPTLPRGPS